MNITRIAEGEIPQRYKDAGSALAKRLAAFDRAESPQKAQQVQKAQSVQQIQQVSFAETLSQVQQAQKARPAQKPDSVALALGERAFESLAASEMQMARVASGWK